MESFFDSGGGMDGKMNTHQPQLQMSPPQVATNLLSTPGSNDQLTPGQEFYRIWEIANAGSDVWPLHCILQFVGGDQMSGPTRLDVPPLSPTQVVQLKLDFTAPSRGGQYAGQWRFAYELDGMVRYFGDGLWQVIMVEDIDVVNRMMIGGFHFDNNDNNNYNYSGMYSGDANAGDNNSNSMNDMAND